jgi:hypothetical protein
MSTTEDRMAEHLRQALADPEQTVVVASLDAKCGMVRQARTARTQDLVTLGQSLLSEAADRLEEIEDPSAEDKYMLHLLRDVVEVLPDPLADEGGDA